MYHGQPRPWAKSTTVNLPQGAVNFPGPEIDQPTLQTGRPIQVYFKKNIDMAIAANKKLAQRGL